MKTTFGTSVPGSTPAASLLSRLNSVDSAEQPQQKGNLEVREKFQDFAAGTFYKEMLKALRHGQKNSKYFYGGQAEEIFRGQMDQQIAEELAHHHGKSFAGPLYEAFSQQSLSNSSRGPSAEASHAFDAVA